MPSPAALVICQCFCLCDGFVHLFRIGTRARQPCDSLPPLQSSYPPHTSAIPHLLMRFSPSLNPGLSSFRPPHFPRLGPPSTRSALCSSPRPRSFPTPQFLAMFPPGRACPVPSDPVSVPLSSVLGFPQGAEHICLSIPERTPMDRQTKLSHPSLLP